ncbi:MAG: helix-turn-helix domain-containing protein [Desulfurivibrionaceae bacterium]
MSFKQVWDRIQKEIGVKNQHELAGIINLSQAVVSKYKTKNTFPVEWAYIIAKKNNLSTEWIMTGEGPKRLSDSATTSDQEGTPRGIIEEWVQEIREKEGNDGRIVMELSLEVKEFREWFREKKNKSGGAEVGLPHENVA